MTIHESLPAYRSQSSRIAREKAVPVHVASLPRKREGVHCPHSNLPTFPVQGHRYGHDVYRAFVQRSYFR